MHEDRKKELPRLVHLCQMSTRNSIKLEYDRQYHMYSLQILIEVCLRLVFREDGKVGPANDGSGQLRISWMMELLSQGAEAVSMRLCFIP